MGSENVAEFTDTNFEDEAIKCDVPVLVDFWAEWCMPCKMISPIVHELADDYAGKVKIGQMDTDNNRQVPLKYDISAIPTLILLKDGEPAKKFVGLQQKADLKAAIDELLTS